MKRYVRLAPGAPLTRKTPMKQRRATPRRSSSRGPIDAPYRARVRTLPCAARHLSRRHPCRGPIEADHQGRKPGVAMKCNDLLCVPMCKLHHFWRTSWTGPFGGWSRYKMAAWRKEQIMKTQVSLLGAVDQQSLEDLEKLGAIAE